MALNDATLSLVAFKQLQGKSMTDINKGVGNEAEGIKLNIDASSVFVNEIDSTPATAVFLGVAEFVIADLTLDVTSNSQAYFATYPIGHPKVGQRIVNAISPSYGSGYEAKPYAGASPIPINDPIDWIYQYQSGVFYFQDPGSLTGTPTTIELYVYTGDLLSDIVGSIALTEPDWLTTTAGDLQMIPTGNTLPNLDNTNDLGSSLLAWKDLYLSGNINFTNTLQITGGTDIEITSTNKTILTGDLQIIEGNEGLGKVLTSDALGNATWQSSGGGGYQPDNVTIGLNTAGELEVIAIPISNISILTPDDKFLTSLATIGDNQLATNDTITNTPIDECYVAVYYNGQELEVGDGVKTKVFYFSGDSGTSARGFSSGHPNGQIQAGDELYFNESIAGFALQSGSRISLMYMVTI